MKHFFGVKTVADEAGISRQTLYKWLKSGIVSQPKHNLGQNRPIFTAAELKKIKRIANERKWHCIYSRLSL